MTPAGARCFFFARWQGNSPRLVRLNMTFGKEWIEENKCYILQTNFICTFHRLQGVRLTLWFNINLKWKKFFHHRLIMVLIVLRIWSKPLSHAIYHTCHFRNRDIAMLVVYLEGLYSKRHHSMSHVGSHHILRLTTARVLFLQPQTYLSFSS